MTTVLCFCRVADYDHFQSGYERAIQLIPGMLSYRLWRGQDDPNTVVIEETFPSRDVAQAVWTAPETQQAMIADGIDMSTVRIEYLDEVASGTL
jgi:quinol monooxygenase YgiN